MAHDFGIKRGTMEGRSTYEAVELSVDVAKLEDKIEDEISAVVDLKALALALSWLELDTTADEVE